MFFVGDQPEHRKKKIRDYLRREPMIAVLLAAANFEWTVGRCILVLGTSPNVELREQLARCHGLDKYKKLWRDELMVVDPTIPPLAQVIKKWESFKEAFVLRHKLIHGRGTCSRNMALEPVELMLSAADDLNEFAASRGKNLHDRLPVRRRKKQAGKLV
jgi:hypothetical protein